MAEANLSEEVLFKIVSTDMLMSSSLMKKTLQEFLLHKQNMIEHVQAMSDV